MKILALYATENAQQGAYGSHSPLMKEIHRLYDCDEVLLPKDCPEMEYANIIRNYDVLLTKWHSPHIPTELAKDPGKLRYICNITGELSQWIDKEIIESPRIIVTNWGDAMAFSVAEGAFALLMSVLKDIPLHIKNARENQPYGLTSPTQGSLFGRRVGIYGMGVIAKKFVDFLRPFAPEIYAFDPFAKDIPDDVVMVDSLEALFGSSQILVIHAALTKATKKSVTKELLAMLPDGGILINTSRSQIVDHQALREELLSGRLRAGLDVTGDRDMPDLDDPIRQLDNAIFTGHHIYLGDWCKNPDALDFPSINCLKNLARFQKGEPLTFVMTPERYRLST